MEAYTFSIVAICSFGVIGNSLVIASLLKQKILLKKNFYFLVLHLAICDLLVLLKIFPIYIIRVTTSFNCVRMDRTIVWFQISGVSMMLIISFLRYRAIVHPLKPSFSRRKIKIVCGLAYIIGFLMAVEVATQPCILGPEGRYYIYTLLAFYACFYIIPVMFMTVVYSIIARALIKQKKALKAFSNVTQSHLQSNSSLQRHTQNRKTFFVCISTVFCFALGHIYFTIARLDMFYSAETNMLNLLVAYCFRVLGSHAVNPLIYGVLDRKVLCFWKRCTGRQI